MNRRSLFIISTTILLAAILLATVPVLGSGFDQGLSQTWPSRTPTPSGPAPNPPGTEPPPEATPAPGSSPPATLAPSGPGAGAATVEPSTGASGPSVGQPSAGELEGQIQAGSGALRLPSAADVGPCGLPPIAIAQGPVNIRSGPGIEFETVASLAFQEERVIVGRAANAAWWQILLSAEQLGWVSDQAVTVVGYTGLVQITYEDQVTSGQPLWNPTPNPGCEQPSQEEIAISDGQLSSVVLVPRPTVDSNRAPTPEADDGLVNESAGPTFSLTRPDDGALGVNLIWLPIVGGFLIIAGGIALLVQRRQR